MPLGDPHALSCILHDDQILWIYLYPLGFRDANQLPGVPKEAVYRGGQVLSLYIDILTLRPKVFFLFYSYFFVAISEPLTHRDPQSTIVKFPIIALVKMTKSGHLFPES